MTRIGIILGSTRPGRNGEAVAKWVYEVASDRIDAEFELIDLKDFNLPHLDEVMPPRSGNTVCRTRSSGLARSPSSTGTPS
jgi:NAD(P)H-dependent FMN reductase